MFEWFDGLCDSNVYQICCLKPVDYNLDRDFFPTLAHNRQQHTTPNTINHVTKVKPDTQLDLNTGYLDARGSLTTAITYHKYTRNHVFITVTTKCHRRHINGIGHRSRSRSHTSIFRVTSNRYAHDNGGISGSGSSAPRCSYRTLKSWTLGTRQKYADLISSYLPFQLYLPSHPCSLHPLLSSITSQY